MNMMKNDSKYAGSNDPDVIEGARMYLRDGKMKKIRQEGVSREYKSIKKFVQAMMDTLTEGDISDKFADTDWQPVAEKMLANIWKQQNKMKVVRK
jgi:hypothetical protein